MGTVLTPLAHFMPSVQKGLPSCQVAGKKLRADGREDKRESLTT